MNTHVMAAITAAIQAYMENEKVEQQKRFGQKLSPWKMAARRETMSKRSLTDRGDPARMRLRRYSLL
jgi:hypothetical protein